MRSGSEHFTDPKVPAQRRYEALRAYFIEELSAAEVGERFGYSPANVHQMASELRSGKAAFFIDSKPGPKGPSKALRIRDQVLALRAQERSVTEIAQALTAQGTPVSAQTVWAILDAEGLERLERRAPAQRGAPPPRLEPVKSRAIPFWPAGEQIVCDHAGLFLLVPGIVEAPVRRLAVRNIGRDQPTLLITNDIEQTTKQLFGRYAERMGIENELDAYIGGFHLDALSSGLPLNVDLDTTLTVIAGNLYRLLARKLPRYERATPDRIWRHFLDSTGTLHLTDDTLTINLHLRTYHPVLIDAGLADQTTPIPWLDNRQLRFRFPPR